jgi:hypothetical protein
MCASAAMPPRRGIGVCKAKAMQISTLRKVNLLGKCNFLASRLGRYSPESDRLLRCREMSLWAIQVILRRKKVSSLFADDYFITSLGTGNKPTKRKRRQ